MTKRHIVLFRKPAPNVLDWDLHVVEHEENIERVIENIKNQGVHQYHTYELGAQLKEFSSEY